MNIYNKILSTILMLAILGNLGLAVSTLEKRSGPIDEIAAAVPRTALTPMPTKAPKLIHFVSAEPLPQHKPMVIK